MTKRGLPGTKWMSWTPPAGSLGRRDAEGKRGLLPVGIEEVLDEKKGLKAPMRELDRQLISFGQIKDEPRWRFDRTILRQVPDSEVGHLQSARRDLPAIAGAMPQYAVKSGARGMAKPVP